MAGFGIPLPEPDINVVNYILPSLGEMIYDVANTVANGITDAVNALKCEMQASTSTLSRSMSGSVSYDTTSLSNVIQSLQTAIVNQTSSLSQILNQVEVAVSGPPAPVAPQVTVNIPPPIVNVQAPQTTSIYNQQSTQNVSNVSEQTAVSKPVSIYSPDYGEVTLIEGFPGYALTQDNRVVNLSSNISAPTTAQQITLEQILSQGLVQASGNPYQALAGDRPPPVDEGRRYTPQERGEYVPPKLPPSSRWFTCPTAPSLLVDGVGIVGTPQWCRATEELLTWMEQVSRLIGTVIDSAVKPEQWVETVGQLRGTLGNWGILNSFADGLIALLRFVAQLAGDAILSLKSAIQCAYYYAKIMTPIRRPEAYTGVLIVRNIITWIRGSKIGSQSYLGFTIGTSLQLPQLEQYLDYLLTYLCPVELPGLPEIMEAWLRNRIDKGQFECLLKLHGLDPALIQPFVLARGEQLSPKEAIQLVRRNKGDFVSEINALRECGFLDGSKAADFVKMYDELPSIAEHLHWMQRNVFNPEYVKDYQLMEGFEERFWKCFGDDLRAQGYTKQRAEYEYAAHWIMPSPEQMKQFFFRLRPGRNKDGITFKLEDYKRILAEQDYNILAREWFGATAYNVPALSYLRDMHRMNLLTNEQMREYHADLGYSESDSELFVQVDSVRKVRMRADMSHGWNPAALAKASVNGSLPEDAIKQRMSELGYTTDETKDMLDRAKSDIKSTVVSRARSRVLSGTIKVVGDGIAVGTMSDSDGIALLNAIGWDSETAETIVKIEHARATTARVKHVINHLRGAFLRGEVDQSYVEYELILLGVQSNAISQYVAAWQLEQTPSRKRRTASQITQDVADGNLSVSTASVMLENLGYEDADVRLYLADARQKTVQGEAALSAANALAGRSRSAALADLARQSDGISRRAVSRLKAQESPSKLMSWLCLGTVTPSYVVARLRLYGYDESSIRNWLRGAKKKSGRCLNELEIETAMGATVIAEVEVDNEEEEEAAANGPEGKVNGEAVNP